MDDPFAVCAFQRAGDLRGEPQRVLDVQGSARDPVSQRFTLEVLHDEELDAVLLADVVKRADVRMVQRGDALRLALETLTKKRVARQRWRQHFNGNDPVEPGVARPVDLAHAARPERREDFVRPQAGARRQ